MTITSSLLSKPPQFSKLVVRLAMQSPEWILRIGDRARIMLAKQFMQQPIPSKL